MAINKNHEFEELNGIKCGIVEKNVNPERVEFLRSLLTLNGYDVVVIPSPPPKAAPAPVAAGSEIAPVSNLPEGPNTFTIGVTDYTFNPINAIFGRLLKTGDGQIVTLAYWKQETTINDDERPYFSE